MNETFEGMAEQALNSSGIEFSNPDLFFLGLKVIAKQLIEDLFDIGDILFKIKQEVERETPGTECHA